ncbi:Flagellar biosynthetic protein FliP precursor [Planctomycetes bacterium Pan216]|uniref:Flagellar biosynthetic protein FliP n=1 Tax=Kolteria novifilia TaxID=2527975 RepID=A0A518B964_9BACT|nr:Flagellar biosynthetic protein FliP precursor [Planctomycetes bacterium Pan216]
MAGNRDRTSRWLSIASLALLVVLAAPMPAFAQQQGAAVADPAQILGQLQPPELEEWFGPRRLTNTMILFLLLTVLTLAPAIIIMTTSFVRIIIVLSITRQALGTQQLPPSSVLTTIALFMTFHIMMPIGENMYENAVVPYSEGRIDADQLMAGLIDPLRDFMAQQIENTSNQDDVWLFVDYNPTIDADSIQTYDDVPLSVLLPAYLLSELRTAFLIGFQLFLPFLIIDMAISSILVSMGMMMLPPVLISLPFKLLLFVLVDGWRLIAETLLISFSPLTDYVSTTGG